MVVRQRARSWCADAEIDPMQKTSLFHHRKPKDFRRISATAQPMQKPSVL
jgi:hypothetical protein